MRAAAWRGASVGVSLDLRPTIRARVTRRGIVTPLRADKARHVARRNGHNCGEAILCHESWRVTLTVVAQGMNRDERQFQ